MSFRDTTFITFNGRKFKLDEMSHQHLSNFIYYVHYDRSHPLAGNVSFMAAACEVIMEKWNNVVLPYRPHPLCNVEILSLRTRGMLVMKNKRIIIVDPITAKQIGEIVDGEFIEDE